jgi:hypothetical protein
VTTITLQDGKVVFPAGRVGTGQPCCCPCGPPCVACLAGCLTVTIEDFSGGEGCDSCAALNGTYSLSRGAGYGVRAYATVADRDSLGVGAVVELLLGWNAGDGTYSVTGVDVLEGGLWYGQNNEIGVLDIVHGFVACGNSPVVEFVAERVAPPQPPSIGIGWTYTNVAQGFQSAGISALLGVTWEPKNETAGEETWEVLGVVVHSGGRDYRSQETIRLRSGGAFSQFMLSEFLGFIEVDHSEPQVDAFEVETDAGTGAEFSATFALDSDLFDLYSADGFDGRYWQISSLSITNAGTGYAVGDTIRYSILGQHETAPALSGQVQAWYDIAQVLTVGGNGEITSLAFPSPGPAASHFRTDGEIQYIVTEDAGEFFWPGPITGGTVISGGTIYPDNPCEWTLCENVECGEETLCRTIKLAVSGGSAQLTATVGSTTVLEATASSPEPSDCTSLSIAEEDMTVPEGCTPGTITIAAGECSGPAQPSCCQAEVVCDFSGSSLWAVSSVGCDPIDPCTSFVPANVHCDLATGVRTDGLATPQLGPDEQIQSWVESPSELSVFYSRTLIFNGSTLNENVTLEIEQQAQKWRLVTAIYNASSLVVQGDSSALRSYTGSLSSVADEDRPYCTEDLLDSIVVTVDSTGLTFGSTRHDFTLVEEDQTSGANPPAFLALDSLPAFTTELSWVVKPNDCGNPLP